MVDRSDRYTWSSDDIVFEEKKSVIIHEPEHNHKHDHDHTPSLYVPVDTVEVKTVHEEAVKELRAWQKFVANGTAQKREFLTYMVRDDIADELRDAIERAGDDADAIKAAFWHAEAQSVIKSDAVVKSQYELEIKRLIDRGRAGTLERRAFTNQLKKINFEHQETAFLAGLRDGGVIINDMEEITAEDASVLGSMKNEHARHATGLSDLLYKKKLSDAQAKLKPRQWYGKTIKPFYDAGLLSAARNQMVEFVGPVDDNSCESCKALVGQRHRRRAFAAAGFNPPYGSSIKCGDGGLCKHRLISVNSRPRGNLSRVPRK